MRIHSKHTDKKENKPGFRIKTLTALVVVDVDGDEGIPAIQAPNGMVLPCVAADEARLNDYLAMARKWVESGEMREVKVMRFTHAKVLEIIKSQK